MSWIQYALWGYLILFGTVAFFVYAACVMAARADRAEAERNQPKRPAKTSPAVLTSPQIDPLPPQPQKVKAAPIDPESYT